MDSNPGSSLSSLENTSDAGGNKLHKDSNPSSSLSSPENTFAVISLYFDDAMIDYTSALSLDNQPLISFIENNSATYLSSGNPCLDFFFHVLPNTPPEDLIERLQLSWNHNPLATLKLVCNLRAIRGSGKSDKESFYTAALWLHKHHPKTLASNIPLLVEFGYFKDLLEILYRLIEGLEVRRIAKSEWKSKKSVKGKGEARNLYFLSKKNEKTKKNDDEEMKAKLRARVPREQRIEANRAQMKAEQEKAKASRNDKVTLICESIARTIYPRNSDPEFDRLDDANYAFKIKNRFRKQVLVPLHNALKLPEV
ncbi:hypothetical protein L1887_13581 [Cichorium endivia]|nr:hypothetical protein L1887_13581 [Cichorium endivia]